MRDLITVTVIAVAGCIVSTTGCGSRTRLEGLVPVEGTVTHRGKAVAGATVVFVPATAATRAAVGTTDAAGRFSLTTKDPGDGAAPGPYLITISKTEARGGLSTAEAEQWSRRRENFGRYPPRPKITELLPKKFKVANTSGLQATVAPGQNILDFSLNE